MEKKLITVDIFTHFVLHESAIVHYHYIFFHAYLPTSRALLKTKINKFMKQNL